MKICMNEDPAKRPKFDMIVPILDKMQDKWANLPGRPIPPNPTHPPEHWVHSIALKIHHSPKCSKPL